MRSNLKKRRFFKNFWRQGFAPKRKKLGDASSAPISCLQKNQADHFTHSCTFFGSVSLILEEDNKKDRPRRQTFTRKNLNHTVLWSKNVEATNRETWEATLVG